MAEIRDPVCGTVVDQGAAERVEHGSHTHYFCSAACRESFLAAPRRYEDAHAGGREPARQGGDDVPLERHEPPHTTTGPITAPKFGSAGSGGLEYERLPERHDRSE